MAQVTITFDEKEREVLELELEKILNSYDVNADTPEEVWMKKYYTIGSGCEYIPFFQKLYKKVRDASGS